MTPAQARKIIKQIEKHERAVAKARDDLDDYIGTLDQLRGDCDEAWDDLQRARDALSRFV